MYEKFAAHFFVKKHPETLYDVFVIKWKCLMSFWLHIVYKLLCFTYILKEGPFFLYKGT